MSAGWSTGLVQVHTDALKLLLREVHRKEITCPLQVTDLTRIGLQSNAEEILGSLRGLDEPGVRAVLIGVLAERKR